MRIGTKSVLYGAHCAVVHPWFLAAAWRKLYGFPWDIRLWCAFWLHDAGYFSKRDMDGLDGETHVELGARIMAFLFGESWGAFTAAHSRYWAKRNGRQFSRLCVADKLAFVLTPAWLYLPMAMATGELSEYMLRAKERQAGCEPSSRIGQAQNPRQHGCEGGWDRSVTAGQPKQRPFASRQPGRFHLRPGQHRHRCSGGEKDQGHRSGEEHQHTTGIA